MKQIDRDALRDWDKFKESIWKSTPVDLDMSAADIEKHKAELEKNPEEWILFFFPLYAKYPFAAFQLKAIKRILANPEWNEVLSWSRELSKSTITMFVVMYLTLTGQKKNVLLTSNNEKNAIRLLAPYRAELEANQRIIAYYGEQQNLGSWTEEEFITKKGVAFRAVGAGQSPRGSRNEAIRPDVILVDDFDTDEECRNPDSLNKKWEWYESALYFTRSMSEPTLILWNGNIIAEDCCVVRAGKLADHWDIINLRMVNIKKHDPLEDFAHGVSVWPEKNTEEHLKRVLSGVSMKAVMAECFNNPISEGSVFGPEKWGKIPPLKNFKFLIVYGDPTQSEGKGTSKNKKGSRKAVWLLGKIGTTLYVIKGFIAKGSNREFIEYYFALHKYVDGKVPVYYWIENNSLQDPFYRQVFKKHVAEVSKEQKITMSISPDEEKKTDKAVRIEANLEPLSREGNIVLNIAEKEDPHMKELVNEFKYFTLALKYPADGIDCIEGGLRKIDQKINQLSPPHIITTQDIRSLNKHRI